MVTPSNGKFPSDCNCSAPIQLGVMTARGIANSGGLAYGFRLSYPSTLNWPAELNLARAFFFSTPQAFFRSLEPAP
jgi:hypothetical protein